MRAFLLAAIVARLARATSVRACLLSMVAASSASAAFFNLATVSFTAGHYGGVSEKMPAKHKDEASAIGARGSSPEYDIPHMRGSEAFTTAAGVMGGALGPQRGSPRPPAP